MTAPIVTKTCTRTHSISIKRLKGVRDLDTVSFEDKPITGIFGPNGNGKSTILHALAAAYQAHSHATSNHYWSFFPRLNHDVWNGVQFDITHSGELGSGGDRFERAQDRYHKGEAATRWKPLDTRRPIREVVYCGLKSCLPSLERYSWHDLAKAVATAINDRPEIRALAGLGVILNGNYTAAYRLTLPDYPTRSYLAFDREDCGNYVSVTMGAGEQRLFELLCTIERTRNQALILIDEIDVLLHGDALLRLVRHLAKHCEEKEKQIVFTSHREALLSLGDYINIRHLHRDAGQAPAVNRCFDSTDPDSLRRLTGSQRRTLEVFVEDDLAEALVSQVASSLGLQRHLRVIRFGAAQNCFAVLAGLMIKGETCENSLFVLDGDVYRDAEERQNRINSACSGDDERAVNIRAAMSGKISDLTLPPNTKPEPFIHGLIVAQDPVSMSPAEQEIHRVATEINNPGDSHNFINKLVEVLGENRVVQLTRVIPLAAKSAEWPDYVKPIQIWLQERQHTLGLT